MPYIWRDIHAASGWGRDGYKSCTKQSTKKKALEMLHDALTAFAGKKSYSGFPLVPAGLRLSFHPRGFPFALTDGLLPPPPPGGFTSKGGFVDIFEKNSLKK